MARGGQAVRVAEFKEVKVSGESLFLLRREDEMAEGFRVWVHQERLSNAAVEGQRVSLVGIGIPEIALIAADSAFVYDITKGGTAFATTWTAHVKLSRYGVERDSKGVYRLNREGSFVPGRGETPENTFRIYGTTAHMDVLLWFGVRDDVETANEGRFFISAGCRFEGTARVVIAKLAKRETASSGAVEITPDMSDVARRA